MRAAQDTPADRELAAQLIDQVLAAAVSRGARCADGTLDPDEWFPVSTEAAAARREAAGAIAVCAACPVRGACLELALRYWVIGQHGVWGGLVPAERAALRRRWPAAAARPGSGGLRFHRVADGQRSRVPPATIAAG
jgi:WhiB family redox-sensing transcriptional regulator